LTQKPNYKEQPMNSSHQNQEPQVLQMSPEQVSQAMDCLYHQKQPQGELLSLTLEHWEELSQLLINLLKEKRRSSVH
jgi:hypothetical protein